MAQGQYQYFDMDTLVASIGFSRSEWEKGRKMAVSGIFVLDDVQVGYSNSQDETICSAEGHTAKDGRKIETTVIFSRNKVLRSQCNCTTCSRYGYWWQKTSRHCAYLAALMVGAGQDLASNPRGDATTRQTTRLLSILSEQRMTRIAADTTSQQPVSIEPFLRSSEDDLQLFFRIVEKKTFVIRDLSEFLLHVEEGDTALYGSKTEISHKIENFDSRSVEWINLLRQMVQEEEHAHALMQRMADRNYMYFRSTRCGNLSLYGWRLDRFYEVLGEDHILYEETVSDDGRSKKVRHQLNRMDVTPEIPLQITPILEGQERIFHGVHVHFRTPVFYSGTDHLYYIREEQLCRTPKEQFTAIQPLIDRAENGSLELDVGRAHLAEFYYSVLPQLSDAVCVMEEEPDLIRQYLPSDVTFRFYLDAAEGDVTCRAHAFYEDTGIQSSMSGREQAGDAREVSLLDILNPAMQYPSWRMPGREQEVLYPLLHLFRSADRQTDELGCNGDEDVIYDVLENGIPLMESMGEVHCTERFRNLHVIRRVRVSVGVAVESNLLDLEIATQDLSQQELLDVLHSYRLKKHYHRLRNGNFVSTEDASLQMLDELTSSLQIADKELLRGRIHLPVYRTLYLNRLLEENGEVYNTRDARFREMVKNFKTVQDADYDVPASLQGILRGYQVTGYKWLRTLLSCGFGGILADEMGLGKTLQTIAVLLAFKEEGEPGAAASPRADEGAPSGAVSLVISPASLVYNWCEEFARFAPQLKVLPITGTQSERRLRLSEAAQYDVLVTSYDLLKRDITEYEGMEFQLEVIDEAQYIKNHTTAAAKAVKVIRARGRLALTGTPIENRLSELWSIFDYLMPGFLYRYETFRRQYETPIIKNQDQAAMSRLQKMTGPFILRRLKTEVLRDLPEKLEENRYYPMEGDQRKLYDAQVLNMRQELSSRSDEDYQKERFQILAEITRLRQICCDPHLCFDNYQGGSAKLEGCLDLIRSAIDGGHKVLLFSQFTSMLEILEDRLRQDGIDTYCITGATAKEKRLQLVKAFNSNDVPVFLVSLKAGGVGLNLTGADVVIHYDPWWNVAVQNQATDRAHRIGQTRKVTVYRLLAARSIEEKIQRLQETKKDLADQILESGGGQLTQMTREELLQLLQG